MNRADLKELLWATFGHLSDTELMALVIYGEARGESREGKIAVGSVILERVEHRKWDGENIHEVCLMPYQFSCLLPDDPNFDPLTFIADDFDLKRTRSSVLAECYWIAHGLINGDIPRTPEIAENHITQYVSAAYRKTTPIRANRWWEKMKLAATIGNHEFYV